MSYKDTIRNITLGEVERLKNTIIRTFANCILQFILQLLGFHTQESSHVNKFR